MQNERLPPSGEEVRRSNERERDEALTRAKKEADEDKQLAGVARRISM